MQAIEDELTPFGYITGRSEVAETFVDAEGDRWSVVDINSRSSNW
jgi:hypothetical protein